MYYLQVIWKMPLPTILLLMELMILHWLESAIKHWLAQEKIGLRDAVMISAVNGAGLKSQNILEFSSALGSPMLVVEKYGFQEVEYQPLKYFAEECGEAWRKDARVHK